MMFKVQGQDLGLGITMGPPADMEYAVLPEGVAMMSPSACTIMLCHTFSSYIGTPSAGE